MKIFIIFLLLFGLVWCDIGDFDHYLYGEDYNENDDVITANRQINVNQDEHYKNDKDYNRDDYFEEDYKNDYDGRGGRKANDDNKFFGRNVEPDNYDEEVSYGVAVPYLCLMSYKGYEQTCSAALIEPRWALTSARCIKNWNPEYTTIRFGIIHAKEKHAVVRNVSKFIFHNYFNPNEQSLMERDIALVRFDKKLRFSRRIKPVQLYSYTWESGLVLNCEVAGFDAFNVSLLYKARAANGGHCLCLDTGRFVCIKETLVDNKCIQDLGSTLVCSNYLIGINYGPYSIENCNHRRFKEKRELDYDDQQKTEKEYQGNDEYSITNEVLDEFESETIEEDSEGTSDISISMDGDYQSADVANQTPDEESLSRNQQTAVEEDQKMSPVYTNVHYDAPAERIKGEDDQRTTEDSQDIIYYSSTETVSTNFIKEETTSYKPEVTGKIRVPMKHRKKKYKETKVKSDKTPFTTTAPRRRKECSNPDDMIIYTYTNDFVRWIDSEINRYPHDNVIYLEEVGYRAYHPDEASEDIIYHTTTELSYPYHDVLEVHDIVIDTHEQILARGSVSFLNIVLTLFSVNALFFI